MNGLGRSGCHCRLMSSSSFPWWVLTFGRHSCMMATACTPQLFKCQMFTVCFSSKLNTEGSATPPFLSSANRVWPFRHREYERFIPATWNCLLHVCILCFWLGLLVSQMREKIDMDSYLLENLLEKENSFLSTRVNATVTQRLLWPACFCLDAGEP